EAERPLVRGEEELAADLSRQGPLQTARREQLGSEVRDALCGEHRLADRLGPVLEQGDERVARPHELRDADAEVAPFLRQRERRYVHDGARPLGWIERDAAED